MNQVTYVPHPADPTDPTMGYFATYAKEGNKIIPLLLTDHEFKKATERAKKRADFMPGPDEDLGVQLYPRTWFHRLLLRFIPRTP